MAAASALPTGTVIGNFRIDSLLGTGRYGSVMKATRLRDMECFAIKIQQLPDDFYVIQNECNALMRVCDYPGCVKIMEAFSEMNRQVFVLELLGETVLASSIKVGKWNQKNTIQLAYQLVETLEFLRVRGILHRDLNSSNICLSSDFSRVVVVDFGLASVLGFPGPTVFMRQSWTCAPCINDGAEYLFEHELFSIFLVLLDVRNKQHLWKGRTLEETKEKKYTMMNSNNLATLFGFDDQFLIPLFTEIRRQQQTRANYIVLRHVLCRDVLNFSPTPFSTRIIDGEKVIFSGF